MCRGSSLPSDLRIFHTSIPKMEFNILLEETRLVSEVTFISFRVAPFVVVNELQTITTRVSDEVFQDIKKIGSEEKAERAEVIRRLLAEAIKIWKLKRALDTVRQGKMTLRSAARLAGLTYIEMMDEVEKAGIPVDYTLADLQIDLEAIKKKEE